jgi:hypothetical protein
LNRALVSSAAWHDGRPLDPGKMFATRNNENAIYEQQTTTAAKNQGVKGLAPKTPAANKAPKTPFKLPLNDENAALPTGKTGKGKDGGLFPKAGKADASAFQTPAGPRNRAPLGNKTTNAKALQTPAPATQERPLSAKPTSPRLRRAKVKIHGAEVDPLEDDGDERDIEYMPPHDEPLPDLPDDWTDRQYPQFEGKNLTRGWWQTSDKDPEEFSDLEEKLRQVEERQRKKDKAVAKAALGEKAPGPLSSRKAASALSNTQRPAIRPKGSVPSFALPTARTKARLPTTLASKKLASVALTGNPRHTAAKVASNTTLGYSKGRAVSGATRKPLSAILNQPTEAVKPAPSGVKTLEDLFASASLNLGGDDKDDDDLGFKAGSSEDEGDDLADFELSTGD